MVPEKEIFAGNEFTGVNKNRETEFIPDNVLRQINSALKEEENPYIKYGFVILQTTGMRISDMLNLKIDCLEEHPISGWVLSWYNHKSRKHQQNKVPKECAEAVQNLIEETEKYREEADNELEDYIFIHRVPRGVKAGEINDIYPERYRTWIDNFIEKHNIQGSDGELYNLTPTQFRRTLATDMYSEGRRLLDIKEVLGHSSPRTTGKHYADIKDKERVEVFNKIGIIGDINKVNQEVVEDEETLEWFEKNKDSKARMVDGYCTKPIEEEGKVCDRLKKKRQCFTCKHYITTPEYLETHKKHLKELQEELKNNKYGKHYADHLKPTIEVLKEIITRLEEIQDAS